MVTFTSVPYQMNRQPGSGARPVGGGLGRALKTAVKLGKKAGSTLKKGAKKAKTKFDQKLPPGSIKRKATMIGLGIGAEMATQKAIDKFLGNSSSQKGKGGRFSKYAPDVEKRRKIYDGGLGLMEAELNRRKGRTDATPEKLEAMHKYFAARRQGRQHDLYGPNPPRSVGGGKKAKKGKGKGPKKKGGKKSTKGKNGKKPKKGKKKPKKKVTKNKLMNQRAAAAQWRQIRNTFQI